MSFAADTAFAGAGVSSQDEPDAFLYAGTYTLHGNKLRPRVVQHSGRGDRFTFRLHQERLTYPFKNGLSP